MSRFQLLEDSKPAFTQPLYANITCFPMGCIVLSKFVLRWRSRNLPLACPCCKEQACPGVFRRGRFMIGSQSLQCDRCGTSNPVTFWRFEGAEFAETRTGHIKLHR